MCGVIGFNWKDESLLRKMCESIRHRGPDGKGAYVDDHVSLGHRRLAILDVPGNNQQPMSNEDGTILLIYNGRIYNFPEIKEELAGKGHKFRSHTDTEVIMRAYEEYGADCVHHFNGMWAFCIYDKTKNILFLSRDRFGIKPMYYYFEGDRFIFSSEIKAIIEHDIPRKENRSIIFDYLYFNLTDHSEETFFTGIKRLMPSHNMIFDLAGNRLEIERYYDVQENIVENANDPRKIKELFTESVSRALISNVPMGSCLSGGIDSSSIVVTMRKLNPEAEIKTFSMKFPGEAIDEASYQKDVYEKVNSTNYGVTPQPSELIDDLQDLFITQEEPFSGTSVYGQYRIMKLVHDEGVKVLMDGQGADQVLSGSNYFNGYYYYELLKQFDVSQLLREATQYYSKSKSFIPLTYLGLRMTPDGIKRYLYNHQKAPHLARRFIEENAAREDMRWHISSLSEAAYNSILFYALPHLLRFVDKNSMRFSLESRVPFLDHKLAEYLLSMPNELRVSDGVTKYAFRQAMEDDLPASVLSRHDKIGFETPEEKWLKDEAVVPIVHRILDSKSFMARDFWNWEKVRDMYEKLLKGETSAIFVGTEIWRCVSIELWMRLFIEKQEFVGE
ncbi:asparagine synthase (glutamine-hydrolyzing) [Methanolobus halotolerans]|uniref:Putative asparagine synthetase [glutamine-hydrolyzing] n=1 Tax=Methanolobus halotolerans TaxID=2052935 RepID=A0A4E0PX64_9EURY|nr:asparagine synthase (glutamine-hydrolyzing) [Methanolobus halotolerans]TGC07440.1 asparagine synthase (glutamine-hydrolyzing) [Methanolobus halotolerans]